jgi:hypothetical protein
MSNEKGRISIKEAKVIWLAARSSSISGIFVFLNVL